MFDLSNKLIIFYGLILILGGYFVYLRIKMYRRTPTVVTTPHLSETIPDSTQIELDPVIVDLTADLFTGYLTGRVIGLINANQKELRYYQQLFNIVQTRFIDNPGFNKDDAKISIDDFKFAISVNISKITVVVVRQSLRERLDKIIAIIETTEYYRKDSLLDVMDVHIAFQTALLLIDYHKIIPVDNG